MYGGGKESPNFCCKCSQPPLGERLGEFSAGREGSSRSGCLRSRALSLLGLCREPCLQATAARTRHLPPGFSRGLAGGAAGMWRADCGRLLRRAPGAAATGSREPAPCRRPLWGRAVPPGAAPGLPLTPRRRRRRPSAEGLR